MFEVSVGGSFSATHQLRLTDGLLEPLHSHTWRVTVTFAGPRLDAIGVLVDFTHVQPRLAALLDELDGRNLNELALFRGRNPSAEYVAVHIAERMSDGLPNAVRLACVEVEEAPGCVARYLPAPPSQA